jgi:hypothetical protein
MQGQQVTSDHWYVEVPCTSGGGNSSASRSSSGGTTGASSSSTLTCIGNVPSTGTAGNAITPPTIRCGTTTVTSGITWASTPTNINWSNPVAGTYNSINATASCGNRNQTANCTGTLTVSAAPTLTCVLQQTTGTAGKSIDTPVVKCGNDNIAFNSITWTNAPNWNNPVAGNYNVSARATCNNTASTVSCGSISVAAAPLSSSSVVRSSSSIAAGTSSSATSGVIRYSSLRAGDPGVQTGYASRYWDACKANCSWSGKAQALGSNTRCMNCGSTGMTEIAANDANRSSCDGGGNAYTCFNQIPKTISNDLAYAFAATPGSGNDCGKCYQLQFTGTGKYATDANHRAIEGKTLIVISSNTGYDVSGGQFDILIPGGGVGKYNAFTDQLKGFGINNPNMGEQYGGLLEACEKESGYNASSYQNCLKNKCNSVFSGGNNATAIAKLNEGCLWLANWMQAAGNPNVLYKQVDCPQDLIDRYKATMF